MIFDGAIVGQPARCAKLAGLPAWRRSWLIRSGATKSSSTLTTDRLVDMLSPVHQAKTTRRLKGMTSNNEALQFPVIEPDGPVTRDLTLVERYQTLEMIYTYQYFATYRHIAKHAGWSVANQIADDMAAEAIPHLAAGYKRKFALPGDGADLVAQVHMTEMLVEGADCQTVTETHDEAEYTVLCPWGRAIQSGKFADAAPIYDGLCNRGCWDFMQRVADTVAADLTVTRTEWMGDGAGACRFCVGRATSTTDHAKAGETS